MRKRIFLGVQEIAGMMERLNNAFHEMGIESDFYCMDNYAFGSDKKDELILKKYKVHFDKIIRSTKEYVKNWWYFLEMWDILHIFFHVLFRYDMFIFIYGHGMFFYNKYLSKIEEVEFFILKLFRKKMIMWLVGSDSRAPYCDVYMYKWPNEIERLYRATQKRSRRIRMLEKYMILIDNGASSHFHRKPYLISHGIGIPIDEKEKVHVDKKKDAKPTILHAPSNMKGKGTEIIRDILKEIKEEGYEFEYIEVAGLPHEMVLEKMTTADIAIDQVYCDTPMAGFATEAAINGIPVVVGGYYADVYKKVLPQPIAPTVYCNPEKLKEKIIFLIEHKEERDRIGQEEREYVENNCLATIVANKFLSIFDGSYPDEWIMDPADNEYIWGFGADKKLVADNVVKLIDRYGSQALCLDENSILLKKYIQLYNEKINKGGSLLE